MKYRIIAHTIGIYTGERLVISTLSPKIADRWEDLGFTATTAGAALKAIEALHTPAIPAIRVVRELDLP